MQRSGTKMSDEHFVTIRSVQVYRGGFDASFVTDDGTLRETAMDLEFYAEKSLSFECSCGQRFQKWQTAADHITEVSDDE